MDSTHSGRFTGRPRHIETSRNRRHSPIQRDYLDNNVILEAVRAEIPESQFLNQTWPLNSQIQGNRREYDPIQAAGHFAQQELANISSQFRGYMDDSSQLSSIPPAALSQGRDPRYMLQDTILDEEATNTKISAERQESIMKWFDRSVEMELKKRRDATNIPNTILDPALAALKQRHTEANMNMSKGTLERMAEASASRLEIATQLKQEQINELTDAVDNLVKAEAMCSFAGAVRAAEAAAENASPEEVEEAAAAGARGFQTEVEDVIEETIPGEKPVEVIGYVGITRPKYPIKPKK